MKYCTTDPWNNVSYNHLFTFFEEVEVSDPNAKQDLSGLNPGWRQFSFLLTRFHNWEFGSVCYMNHKATEISVFRTAGSVFLEHANRQKAFQLSIIDVWSIH